MVELDQEQHWLEQSRQGDHAAFENLIRNHQRMIHSMAYRMTGSMADAEDLAQEAFIRAFQQIDSYRGEAKFSSWLCRIAMNACLNWRQREIRRAEIHQDWAEETLRGGSEKKNVAADEDSSRVQAALDRLPVKQRAAIILTVYEEMNHAEAARALGCTEATVSWRVFAARTKLKRWLKPASRGSPGR
ncbi:MAG TPA: RNA polymerase sigma factor [Candidatus Angelobacter sp.]|nr:RNA polymerase sigma factor [Candidatus Angelobacter sp.]